jgi:hypothetical protein
LKEKLIFTDEECSEIGKYDFNQRKEIDEIKPEFKASRTWVRNFRQSRMVALRTAYGCHRPPTSKDDIINFIHKLEDAKSKYPKNCILNCDETNLPVIFGKRNV